MTSRRATLASVANDAMKGKVFEDCRLPISNWRLKGEQIHNRQLPIGNHCLSRISQTGMAEPLAVLTGMGSSTISNHGFSSLSSIFMHAFTETSRTAPS